MQEKKKTSDERFREYVNDLTPFSEMCVNCVFYVQHYIHYSKDYYAAIDAGHCRRRRCRQCRAYDVCDSFENKFYDGEPWA